MISRSAVLSGSECFTRWLVIWTLGCAASYQAETSAIREHATRHAVSFGYDLTLGAGSLFRRSLAWAPRGVAMVAGLEILTVLAAAVVDVGLPHTCQYFLLLLIALLLHQL